MFFDILHPECSERIQRSNVYRSKPVSVTSLAAAGLDLTTLVLATTSSSVYVQRERLPRFPFYNQVLKADKISL